jgi:exodeoxyribonuclease V alpha subunit
MQVENNYDKEVYNGDLGVVSRIDMEEGELHADFDGRDVNYGFGELDELVLAYATTIHKSQGSEYPAVVIPLTTQHYPMLQRNLVYTGVTRGKRLVVRSPAAFALRPPRPPRRRSRSRRFQQWRDRASGLG